MGKTGAVTCLRGKKEPAFLSHGWGLFKLATPVRAPCEVVYWKNPGYIGTVRNIASGAGVMSYNGSPLVVQPPLYPLFLAIVNVFLGIDPLTAAPIINAGLFGLLIYMSGLLFFEYLKPSMLLAFLGTAYLLVLVALVEVSLMAWSELLFICFVLLYLINFRSYQKEGEIRSIVLLSVSVALACMTRYIGAVLIPVGLSAFCCSVLSA